MVQTKISHLSNLLARLSERLLHLRLNLVECLSYDLAFDLHVLAHAEALQQT